MTVAALTYTINGKVLPVDRRLAQSHRDMLEHGSAIDLKVIKERDAWTAINPKELSALGFMGHQQLVPALVLPVWSVTGHIAMYQICPNAPRTKNGKVIKYETPAGARMMLDVHPRIRGLLNNPQNPLCITEGIRCWYLLVSNGDAAILSWGGTAV